MVALPLHWGCGSVIALVFQQAAGVDLEGGDGGQGTAGSGAMMHRTRARFRCGKLAVAVRRTLLGQGEAGLAPVILQELLQGAASPDALRTLRQRFSALPMRMPRPDSATDAGAGVLYARCRWAGYTPRSPHDCLIARLAIEHQAPLLHADRDFEHIAKVETKLILWDR